MAHMKKIILSFVFLGFINAIQSQDASTEETTYGIQTGFLGVWIQNESKLSNNIALRSEIGFDSGIGAGDFYDGVGFILTPVLTLEPRLYYNLNKRVSKGRNIDGNSGNFVSLKTSYHPDWFVISNIENSGIVSDLAIIPTWGIRRQLGNHFMYEVGIGLGYRYLLAKQAGFLENESDAAINLHLRIGYQF